MEDQIHDTDQADWGSSPWSLDVILEWHLAEFSSPKGVAGLVPSERVVGPMVCPLYALST